MENNYGNRDRRSMSRQQDWDNDWNTTNPQNQRQYGHGDVNFNRQDYNQGGGYGSTGYNEGEYRGRQGGYSGTSGNDYSSGNYRNTGYGGSGNRQGGYSGTGSNYGNEGRGYGSSRRQSNDDWNMYGGDTSNHGNMNQGGYDRDWWDRTKDKVASWFGNDDRSERGGGLHRGKGPKGYERSADRIKEDVCERLYEDHYVDASGIEVKVDGSEVVLSGTVNSREEKRRAEDLVEAISGVKNVQNQIRVDRSNDTSTSSGYRTTDDNRRW